MRLKREIPAHLSSLALPAHNVPSCFGSTEKFRPRIRNEEVPRRERGTETKKYAYDRKGITKVVRNYALS